MALLAFGVLASCDVINLRNRKGGSFHISFLFIKKIAAYKSTISKTEERSSGRLRGQMGATAPLPDKNSALVPPFWKEKRPLS